MSAWAVLREARARAGISQRALASRSGVAQSEIARIEGGKQEPSFQRLTQLVGSAGFELRVELAPRNDHDAQLIKDVLLLSPEERLDSLEAQTDFFSDVKELTRGPRR